MLDLVSVLNYYQFKGIQKCTVYGRILRFVPRPENIQQNTIFDGNGRFVEFELFAVNMSYHASLMRQYGFSAPDDIYMVGGKIIAYVPDSVDLGWCMLRGVLRFGSREKQNGYTCLFTYYKDNGNAWRVALCGHDIVYDNVFKGEVASYWQKSLNECSVCHPDGVVSNLESGCAGVATLLNNAHGVPMASNISRKDLKSEPYDIGILRDKCEAAESKWFEVRSYIKANTPIGGETNLIRRLCSRLQTYYRRKPSQYEKTGRALVLGYLQTFSGSNKKYMADKTVAEYLADMFDDIQAYIFDHNRRVDCDGIAWELCRLAFGDRDTFFVGIIKEITGVELPCFAGINNLIERNIYLLVGSVPYKNLEKVAMAFGVHNRQQYSVDRDISCILGKMTETSDTIFRSINGVVPVKSFVSTYLSEDGNYAVADNKNLRLDVNHAVAEAVQRGIIVLHNGFIMETGMLSMELGIYDSMREMASHEYNYDTERIEALISEYEDSVGFSLEPEQREAVYLCTKGSGIISGVAGSGKTTVSKCLVHVIENLEPMLDIRFAAPTGKAAKRMQEVVKRQVKTIHSEFTIGIGDEEDSEEHDIGHCVYFIDEGAMITVPLLYKALSRLDSDTCRVYLFGDVNQLSPIGKGTPFKDLLKFMPCVYLGASKRAMEGSDIITGCMDILGGRLPESRRDFQLQQCPEDVIRQQTVGLCKELLKIYPADNIQVATPFAKEEYSWGSVSLNRVLKPIFNPGRSYRDSYVYREEVISIGDRVIHKDKNTYTMQWYTDCGGGVFQKIYGYGIFNGEVGKVVGFYSSVEILPEEGEAPEDFSYRDSLRDDTTWSDYFVAVKYYDYLEERDFVILYRAKKAFDPSEYGLALTGDDLSMLTLFYAGTVHKLQGSEADVIVCPLGTVHYRGFITREMVYTMFTRGKKQVYGVGSVTGQASMLAHAIADKSSGKTLTVGGVWL